MGSGSPARARPLWQPAVLLPSQLADRRRRAVAPEKLLLAAMFEDAVQCITNVDARNRRRLRDFFDACDWFLEDQAGWPFAFGNVCDFLALDAGAVRQRMQRLVAAQLNRLGDVARPAPVPPSPKRRRPRRRVVKPALGDLTRSSAPQLAIL